MDVLDTRTSDSYIAKLNLLNTNEKETNGNNSNEYQE